MPFAGGKIAPALLRRKINQFVSIPSGAVTITAYAPEVLADVPSSGFQGGTLIAPVIIQLPRDEGANTAHTRLWGSADSGGLGLYRGYINVTTIGAANFPWNRTLSDGKVHYTPRGDYVGGDWYTRWNFSDNSGVSMSASFGFNVWRVNDGNTIGMAHQTDGNAETKIRIDWSTTNSEAGLVFTGYWRFQFDQ